MQSFLGEVGFSGGRQRLIDEQIFDLDRQLADPYAGGVIDGARDGRRIGRRGGR